MAVDKKLLEECIAEAAGDDQEMAAFLRDRYLKNDALAAKFVGGYTRTADYTQKTQALSQKEKEFGTKSSQLESQLASVRAALTAAETEKGKMMKDLAAGRITVAKAREIAKVLHEKYELSDEDLPGISDLIETAKTGKVVDSTDDLDSRFKSFREELKKEIEQDFVKTLMPELGSMASLPIIWQDIAREHEELTGKRISFAEQQEILKLARDGNKPLRAVWEEKYQISPGAWGDGLRMQKRDEKLKADWESERTKADADRRSKEALEVVTGGQKQPDLGTGPGISGAFKTRFRQFEMDPNKAPVADHGGVPSLEVKPGQHVRQTGDRGPSGAQRAAAKFLEQRSGGGTKAA